MKKHSIYFIITGLLFTAFITGCRPEAPPEKTDTAEPVKIAPVVIQETSRPIRTYGRLSAKKEIRLAFKVGGIIADIAVDEGQKVNRGQLLARLNRTEISAQVSQARSAREKAERDFKRVENLYQDRAATLEQYQNVQTALKLAQSRLEAAEFNLRHATIFSPSQGRIFKRLAEAGEMIGPGQPVFLLAATGQDWIVRAGVSDRDLVRLNLGDRGVVRFDAYPEEQFNSELVEIVESADPLTGTYEIELRLQPGENRFVSGFVAEVDIFPSTQQKYFLIPVDALTEAEGSKGYVFTVDRKSGTAVRLEITIDFFLDDRIAISSGLEDIEYVVTEGAPYLSDGASVKIDSDPPV